VELASYYPLHYIAGLTRNLVKKVMDAVTVQDIVVVAGAILLSVVAVQVLCGSPSVPSPSPLRDADVVNRPRGSEIFQKSTRRRSENIYARAVSSRPDGRGRALSIVPEE
jgi:hypothetical protein